MAHTTLDLTPRINRRSGPEDGRAAKFRRASVPGESGQSSMESTARRAAYRPREEVAVRRDVVEEFRNRLERDATHTPDAPEAVEGSLIGIARAEEALGRFEEARLALKRLSNLGDFSPVVWALSRRLHRREGRREAARDTLRRAYEVAEPSLAVLLKLEELRQDWLDDAPPSEVAVALHILAGDMAQQSGDYTRLWKTRLELDALLEQGRIDRVGEVIAQRAVAFDDGEIADLMRTRSAIWSAVWGDVSGAATLLEQIHQRAHLRGDLGEFLGSLYFDLGDRESATTLYRGLSEESELEPTEAVGAAMLQESVARDLGSADKMLADLCAREPEDWTALRVRESLLERHFTAADAGGDDAESGGVSGTGTSLIDVLNMQLEGPLTNGERITKLTRLGRLYEEEAQDQVAAAEVYREALSLKADHLPALRALGRLYAQRDNFSGLVDLYEREIAQMQGAPSVWRRHFQAAELYRVRLENRVRALDHYRHVLDHRPHYLPALKAAAGLLGELGRWRELADLFLASVEVAPNRRQKMYLLDKVAEVAENELQNYDVAIGAWQEILILDDQHPRAFAALGRLYARTGQFAELIELNMRELELVEDDEEEAVLHQKCAEIAERHLEDPQLAEKHYRRALEILPDFLPALEGLGRIYMRNKRWDDIIEMSGRELRETDDPRETIRRLGALAEIFETQLDRSEDAIRIYARILEIAPEDNHALESALRLNYALGRFDQVVVLVERKIAATDDPRAFAALHGELAGVAEWQQGDLAGAFARYLIALDAEPGNGHWLAGIARTWSYSSLSVDEVADRLENNVMKPMNAQARDRYFKVIARLRERAHQSADVSRAFRTHGSTESLENQLVLELAMARGGEREVLHQFRRANPQHPLERLLEIKREGLTVGDVDAIRAAIDVLEPSERAMLLGELPVNVAAEFSSPEDPAELRLSAELVRVLEGEVLRSDEDYQSEDPLALRLRAVEARQSHDFEGYVLWTRRELALRDSRDLKVSRLTELAEFAERHQRHEQVADFLAEAARTAFPEMRAQDEAADKVEPAEQLGAEASEEQGEEVVAEAGLEGDADAANTAEAPDEAEEHFPQDMCDGPTLDRLYQTIRNAEGFAGRWMLLRDCLDAHAMRDGLTRSRRLYLFRTLAEILEEELDDLDGASTALSNCWQLSEDAAYLRELVRVSMALNDLERAIRFQQRHFEHMTNPTRAIGANLCIESGLWLAELLLQSEERIDDGIDCLEHLLASYEECELFEHARRQLAYAYFEHGNPYRAVELFQRVLDGEISSENLKDWRTLVEVYRDKLDDGLTAYELQWQIVDAGLGSAQDLDELVGLGFRADMLKDCAGRLESMATQKGSDMPPARQRQLLGRAAEIVEEDLMWPEEAVRLYTLALERCTGAKNAQDGDGIELLRRRAFCLAQIAGRESQALEEFRKIVLVDPFEPTTYRGLSDLLGRAQAFDRARISDQILRVLNCTVENEALPTKTSPSRLISDEQVEQFLMPAGLNVQMIDTLAAAMPFVEKVWADELPQRKALEGVSLNRLDAQDACDSMQAAMDAFGIPRFKAESGDAGPMTPQVFSAGTPSIWVNWEQISQMNAAEARFIAGYCAALAWSGLPALLALDGRRVWHMVEAVLLKQTGQGFGERVDMATQDLVEHISSPFHAVARRRLTSALEPVMEQFATAECELWPGVLEEFACRVGMVTAGDVSAAVRGLLSFHGWNLGLDAPETQKQIRRNPSVRRLISFAMSDDYLEARYALGLAGRPSKLVS
ncbi:tetratricopeptide repeat protein [Bradymonas sediminis]|nr:tetratricopeptide repeat protein [Bradymonas sediminis]TDP71937.1 tetratricopeptide repeat protein [Bradymonas sediminis]